VRPNSHGFSRLDRDAQHSQPTRIVQRESWAAVTRVRSVRSHTPAHHQPNGPAVQPRGPRGEMVSEHGNAAVRVGCNRELAAVKPGQ